MVRINPKNGKIERFIDFGVLGVLDPRGCAVGGGIGHCLVRLGAGGAWGGGSEGLGVRGVWVWWGLREIRGFKGYGLGFGKGVRFFFWLNRYLGV
jgi:hypothetical protein